MKTVLSTLALLSLLLLIGSASAETPEQPKTFSLTVEVDGLRNDQGAVQFSLYNEEGSIPDQHFERFHRQKVVRVDGNASRTIFEELPAGTYAVSIHHDENRNGKIEKGLILPTEGVGFSNFLRINLANRPSFEKASFQLGSDLTKSIKIIYF